MMSNARRNRLALRVALLLAAGIALCACGATIGKLPESLGGLPETAPQRPAETMPFPNVYEPRPKREAKPLTDFKTEKIFDFAWSFDGKQLAVIRGTEISDAVLISDEK